MSLPIPPTAPSRPPHRRRLWIGLLSFFVGGPILLTGLGIWCVFSCLHVGGDLNALRKSVLPLSGSTHRNIELSFGRIPIQLARWGTAFIPMDPTARAAIRAVHRGEVALYDITKAPSADSWGKILANADKAMASRNWMRAVGVQDDGTLVAVYVPAGDFSSQELEACVLVLDSTQLVLASGKADGQRLWDLASGKLNLEEKARFWCRR